MTLDLEVVEPIARPRGVGPHVVVAVRRAAQRCRRGPPVGGQDVDAAAAPGRRSCRRPCRRRRGNPSPVTVTDLSSCARLDRLGGKNTLPLDTGQLELSGGDLVALLRPELVGGASMKATRRKDFRSRTWAGTSGREQLPWLQPPGSMMVGTASVPCCDFDAVFAERPRGAEPGKIDQLVLVPDLHPAHAQVFRSTPIHW